MIITVLFYMARGLYRLATCIYIVANWHFYAAEKLYLHDINKRLRKGK